jgi:putative PIN family toxin of toxin-antitoxin system
VRAVLDVNILIAALLSPAGAPAHIVSRWLAGDFELVVSEKLLAELERTLSYSKLRSRVSATDATAFIKLLRNSAIMAADREAPPSRSVDPADDYLLALAESERAILVSGDEHLLELADELPVQTARVFLENLGR